jgi:CYTH domain-containing protein
MNLEIERKFLLKCPPKVIREHYTQRSYISQFYLSNKDRYRREIICDEGFVGVQNKYFLTKKKFISEGVNEETEIEISEKLWESKTKESIKYIAKTRYFLPYNNLTFEIDIFPYFIIMEVELPTLNYDLVIPSDLKPYIIREVTEFNEFSNYNLAYDGKPK